MTFTKKDFNSGDGMLTTVWGPPLWHFLHTMSFNYPIKPTEEQKKHYMTFLKSLGYILPCKYCRDNLHNNLKKFPMKESVFKNRETLSKYIYKLHEKVNKMLGKTSELSYETVRERYENFRSRCIVDSDMGQKNEIGCTEPLYGKKAKCVIHIVPKETKCPTFIMSSKCRLMKKN